MLYSLQSRQGVVMIASGRSEDEEGLARFQRALLCSTEAFLKHVTSFQVILFFVEYFKCAQVLYFFKLECPKQQGKARGRTMRDGDASIWDVDCDCCRGLCRAIKLLVYYSYRCRSCGGYFSWPS